MQRGRPVRIIVVATTLALTLGTGPVRAETTGDLYVASTAGILEVVSASASVLDNVPVSPSPVSIAIRPDGRELFALAGGKQVVGIDLESMTVASHLTLPAAGAAIAYPRGEQLVTALPSLRRLAVSEAGSDTLSRSEPFPGAVDLLSADRRDGRVLAAARNGHWVAVFDPGTGSIRSTTVSGDVVAISLDASGGSLVVATTHPNRIVALDIRDFSIRWTLSLSGAPGAIAVAGTTTLVVVGRTVWALDHLPDPGAAALGVSIARPSGHQWASLAKSASALAVSDDGTLVYALEADRVEGFVVDRSASTRSTVAVASRSVRLTGARAPVAIVAVPGAQPLPGGPGVDAQAGKPGTSGDQAPALPAPTRAAPRTDTVLEGAARWADGAALPEAIAVGTVILALGLLAIRRYERGLAEGSTAPSKVDPPRRR